MLFFISIFISIFTFVFLFPYFLFIFIQLLGLFMISITLLHLPPEILAKIASYLTIPSHQGYYDILEDPFTTEPTRTKQWYTLLNLSVVRKNCASLCSTCRTLQTTLAPIVYNFLKLQAFMEGYSIESNERIKQNSLVYRMSHSDKIKSQENVFRSNLKFGLTISTVLLENIKYLHMSRFLKNSPFLVVQDGQIVKTDYSFFDLIENNFLPKLQTVFIVDYETRPHRQPGHYATSKSYDTLLLLKLPLSVEVMIESSDYMTWDTLVGTTETGTPLNISVLTIPHEVGPELEKFATVVDLDLSRVPTSFRRNQPFSAEWLPPNLQTLKCNGVIFESDKSEESIARQHRKLQHLKELTIDFKYYKTNVEVFPIYNQPLPNLTELNVMFESPAMIQQGDNQIEFVTKGIIASSPNLETLQLYINRGHFVGHFMADIGKGRTYLSTIKHLTLQSFMDPEETYESNSRDFIQNLILTNPQLETLSIEISCFRVLSFDFIKTLILSSTSRLKSITVAFSRSVTSMWGKKEIMELIWYTENKNNSNNEKGDIGTTAENPFGVDIGSFCGLIKSLSFLRECDKIDNENSIKFMHFKDVPRIYIDLQLLKSLVKRMET